MVRVARCVRETVVVALRVIVAQAYMGEGKEGGGCADRTYHNAQPVFLSFSASATRLPLLREEDQWLALEVPDPENEARLVRGQGSLHIQVTAKHTHMFRDADMKQSILAVLVEADIDAGG